MVKKDFVTREELELHLIPIKKDINTILNNHLSHMEKDIKEMNERLHRIEITQARRDAKITVVTSVAVIVVQIVMKLVLG